MSSLFYSNELILRPEKSGRRIFLIEVLEV